jgi:hypothetical protein
MRILGLLPSRQWVNIRRIYVFTLFPQEPWVDDAERSLSRHDSFI